MGVPSTVFRAVGAVILMASLASSDKPVRITTTPPPTGASHAIPAGSLGVGEINLRNTVTVEVVRRVKESVVYISTEKIVARSVSPFGGDPVFGNIGRQTVMERRNSLGSGFVIHESGFVVTNNHVVDRARQISVQLSNGKTFAAEVVSTDPDADLAILKIDTPEPLRRLELGDSSDLMIGEPVIAVGNPLGYSYSVSTGIVSAIHREIQASPDKAALSDLVQTDAAINPGNSGGPLLNAYGQVIGINTAIRGDAQNIGFAIQVNKLRDLIPALMDPANVRKIELPVQFVERRTITPPATIKTVVELVTPEGNLPVQTIDGRTPRDIVDAYVQLLQSDLTQNIEVVAGGKKVVVSGKAAPVPDAVAAARRRLGLTVEPVTPAMAERTGLKIEDGMLVTEIVPRSVAERAQLQPGDVIFQVDRFRVRTLEDFGNLVTRLPAKGDVRIGILRGDSVGYGTLRL